MRRKRLIYNTVSSFVFQITTIICGFVLPRLILQSFGSEVNGLVNSITQFLSIIAFLEFGVGAVVQSSLYKPLVDNDSFVISSIIASANNFFKRLAQILLVYIIGLIIIYPRLVNDSFGWLYTALLIVAISISSFAQYYFGVVDRLLLTSAQKGYIQYNAQTITLILNTIACYVLIKLGCSIHIVKLTTSVIYLLRPIFLRWYVNNHYKINRNIKYIGEPIAQKWNGVAQHVAAVVLDGTALIILTIFDNLKSVSIYTVYFLVVSGIKQLFLASTNGIQALLGELWAKQDFEELNKVFSWTEWVLHNLTMFLFGCTALLIVPFVLVYTQGISDANYFQPSFALVLVAAHACHCLRLPYNLMILACGHYKQTQGNYIIATFLNLCISIFTVKFFGLIGVACGALIALAYQVIWMGRYNSQNLLQYPFSKVGKQLLVDLLCILALAVIYSQIPMICSNYFVWVLCVVKVSVIWAVVLLLVNRVFYPEMLGMIMEKFAAYMRK
ncbi:hypothetical protein [uncultured Phascolarctobacterium sp.]|uniref:lipopolysaccharide biosynthesis protein n=1 Tax=uncultured Phascolarctobacterium sp. TaxID=512296 RepID=UPI0025FC627C|nr:hypothetical protein [uncultured Phascolarctobacterium sp.]